MQASPYGTSVQGFREGAAPRFVRIDVLLLLAALGLIACSIYTIASATTRRHRRAAPTTTCTRQAGYAAVGIVLMVADLAHRLLAPARVDGRACTG